MVTTETELKTDIRQMTGYTSEQVLSPDGLDTAYRRAKKHIRVEKSLQSGFEWFNAEFPEREEALFWFSCLFAKVQTGELDSQDLQIGAVDTNSLLAKDDNSVTMWYRNASGALESLKGDQIIRSASPARTGRTYEAGTYDEQSGGSGSEVDQTDL
jgi:hypothetical protein